MAGTRIRVAVPDDAAPIAGIGRAAMPAQYTGLVDSAAVEAAVEQSYSDDALSACVRRCSGSRDAHFLVAERSGELVGFLQFDCFGPEPELHRLYVSETARGSGVGGLLIQALHERIGATCEYMLLVLAGNDGAVRFYERHGLRRAGEVDGLPHYSKHMGVSFRPGTRPFTLIVMRRVCS